MTRDRILARLPRAKGVEVRAVLAPTSWPPVRFETWIRDPAGAWWRSERPAEVSEAEQAALALGLLRLGIAAGDYDAAEVARDLEAEVRRQHGAGEDAP